MTKQEYYDLLVETSKSGKFPARTVSGKCYYRGPDDTKCAVGLLIPDERYDPQIEDRTAIGVSLFDNGRFKDLCPDGMTWYELGQIQAIHDSTFHWDHDFFVAQLNHLFWGKKEVAA